MPTKFGDRFLHVRHVLTAAASALAAIALMGSLASAAPAPTAAEAVQLQQVSSADACLDGEEVKFLGAINNHRQTSGLAPLAVSASLSAAAAYHSVDMAANGYLSHTMLDGTSVSQNMMNFGYQGGAFGENIAAGMDSAAVAFQTWQNSYDHNANMLNGQFGAIGIGRAYSSGSPHGWYWTTIFGDIADEPGWLCGEAPPPAQSVSLYQDTNTATATSDVNLRSGPGEAYDLVETLPANTPLVITGEAQEAYTPVRVDETFGWVASEWIERGNVSLAQTASPSLPGTAMTMEPLMLHSAPDQASQVVGTIPSATSVNLTGEAQDGYLGVTFNDAAGWADASYLQVADVSAQGAPVQSLAQPAAPATTDASAAAPAPVMLAPGSSALTTSNVNLRSQPSADAIVIDVVPSGNPVTVTGSQANGFINVRINGEAGWIDAKYLQPSA